MHKVDARGILSSSNGMNVYRGCLHGCIYCDARSLCYNMQHKFEDIEVKQNAPELLDDALRRKRRKCMIATGAMSDPYIPIEDELFITRRCLEVIERRGFGVTLQTKSARVLRDIDILSRINEKTKCVVQMTLTTYDEALCQKIEPDVSSTRERFEALMRFLETGIPTVVWFTPILPFINDTEENLRGVLDYCFRANVRGIISFGMGVTLRDGDREYFYQALDRHFPGMKRRYIERYGYSYECESDNSPALTRIFHEECKKHGVMSDPWEVFDYLHTFEEKRAQLSLFD